MKPNTEEEKTVLECTKAERGDTGAYKISLENNQGSDTCSCNVIVLGEYIINNFDKTLQYLIFWGLSASEFKRVNT